MSRVAFHVLAHPNSYITGSETIGARGEVDPEIPNERLEWSTKQQGSIVNLALLVKLEER